MRMKEEIILCKECGLPMFKIGMNGRDIHFSDIEGKKIGVRPEYIYQYPEDKTIAIF